MNEDNRLDQIIGISPGEKGADYFVVVIEHHDLYAYAFVYYDGKVRYMNRPSYSKDYWSRDPNWFMSVVLTKKDPGTKILKEFLPIQRGWTVDRTVIEALFRLNAEMSSKD